MGDVEVAEDSLSSVGCSSVSKFASVSEQCSESSEESDSDEEDTEPKLKYERLSPDLRNILQKDRASCMAVHNKFIVLGTDWGVIHLLDAMGNSLASRTQKQHSVRVSQVSIDHAGEFYASCSIDGRIVVTGLYTDDNTHNFKMDKPARTIAIDPIYARANSGRRFMTTSEDKLIIHEKTFLSRYKQDTICQGEGEIHNVRWRGRFAAWATNKGIRVYDVVDDTTISLIPAPSGCPPNSEVPWRIGWGDQFSLIVSYGTTVKVCCVEKRIPIQENLPAYLVRVDASFTIDYNVSGVGHMGDMIVTLAIPLDLDESGKPERPELLIFEKGEDGKEYELVSTDVLSIKGHESYQPKDYQFEVLAEDKFYFIMSPRDVVVGKPRDDDDHVDWLLEHQKFQECLELAAERSANLRRHSYLEVGTIYLDHLMKEGEYRTAGGLLNNILGKDKKRWEEVVFRFAQVKQLKILADFLPSSEDFKLDSAIYEMVLYDFLQTDAEGFLALIRKWPSDLFNTIALSNAVLEHLRADPDNILLLRSLATLFTYQRKYDKAMEVYLRLRHEDVFVLIRQHRLFKAIHDKIPSLMDLNSKETLSLLLDFQGEIPCDLVVKSLVNRTKQLFFYLDALYTRDRKSCPGKFHGFLVKLYADFAPQKLMNFLETSDQYSIQEALDECELRGMTPERIYLLARMGNTRAALNLIIKELADIEYAVQFCKEHEDSELWNDIINYSLDKPLFINYLLHNTGTHIDPRILIEKIEPGLKIPGLRDSLIQILRDYNLQICLEEGFKKILVADCYSLLKRQVSSMSKGVKVSGEMVCPVCTSGLLARDPTRMQNIVVFNCRHAYHTECLPEDNICTQCCTTDKYSTYTYYNKD